MTDTLIGLIGLVTVLISAGLLVGLSVLRRKSNPIFRDIPAFTRMKHAVGRVVEDGTRLLITIPTYYPNRGPALAARGYY